MNLLLLAIAFRAWRGPALSIFLRLSMAIALFSIEAQIVTWSHVGTIRALIPFNLAIAFVSLLASKLVRRGGSSDLPPRPDPGRGVLPMPPVAAIVALSAIVLLLAVRLPVKSADPYHLQRVDQITGKGTLAYDPSVPDIKVNALAGVYELLLADLRIPGLRTAAVRFHGLFGLALYLLTIAVLQMWFPVRRRWLLIAFLVVPVVFHQLVLVKNDLFGAIPALVALAWVVRRGAEPGSPVPGVAIVSGALAGFAVGIKVSSAAVAVVVGLVVLWYCWRDWRAIAGVIAGGLAGAFAGGLVFALIANQQVYGGALQPYLALGNRHETLADSLTGIGRFAISLVDVGRLTPVIWPGRGGWGSTFGLPLIWSVAALAIGWRRPEVRRTAVAAAVCFVMFAASYPDADIAHRLMLAPGLLLIGVAVWVADGDEPGAPMLRTALIPVLLLSALQIARSAYLYLTLKS